MTTVDEWHVIVEAEAHASQKREDRISEADLFSKNFIVFIISFISH